MKKFIAILLTIVCLFSAVACKKGVQVEKVDQTFSGKYLLYNGVTDYVVVLPDDADSNEIFASEELTALFSEATGVDLPVVFDNGLTFNEQDKYISIGNTTLLDSANIKIEDEVKVDDGMALKTKGNTLFFIGGGANGVVYAVYEFLFRTLNFEQYYIDCYNLDKCVTEIPLMNYNVIDYPDFPRYMAFPRFLHMNPIVALRMHAPYSLGNTFAIIDGDYTHTSFLYMNKEVIKGHEDYWLSDDRTQLCYTAHGDEQEYKLMLETYCGRIKETIKKNPNASYYNLMHEDVVTACSCDACKASFTEYGECNSAAYIKFVNTMADMLKEWMTIDPEGREYYDPNFKLMVGAYNLFEKPPVKYNEKTKKYYPIKEDIILRDNVMVGYAPIYADYQRAWTHENNAVYYEVIKQWSVLTDTIYMFIYGTNFDNYMYPYDNYDSMQINYKLFYDLNVKMLCEESQNKNNQGMTGWHILKSFLSCNYGWNVNANQNELIDRFFKGYFLDAAEDMLKFFNGYRAWSSYQENVLCPKMGGIYFRIAEREYWPKPILEEWYGYVNDALKKIEKYKVQSPSTYEMLYKHITQERAFLDYALVTLYKTELGSEYRFYADALIEAATLNGIERSAEHVLLDLDSFKQ